MSKSSEFQTTLPIACDLTAIDAEFRDQHLMSAKDLVSMAQEVRELPDGYAIRLPSDTDTFLETTQFVARERQCCPFFNFTLEIGDNNKPFWLHLTGPDGVKQLLQTELGLH